MAGGGSDIRDLAHETIEIVPPEPAPFAPAHHLADALERVTELSPWRSWPRERELIAGGVETHAPTKAYVIDDVMLSGGHLYKKAGRTHPGFGAARIWDDAGRTQHIETAHLVSCYAGSRFFGPFLKDSLPLELLPDAEAPRITMQTRPYGHEAGYRALFDLPAPPRVQRARIGRLTLYDDFGQNAAKAARYQIMRERLHARLAGGGGTPPAGIYLKRGATGEARVLQNEAALEDALVALGFDVVEPAQLEAAEIARRTLNAPIVISVEGSHMSHVVYSMAANAALLVLQPPDRFAMAFKEFTDRMGYRFGFVVGHPVKDGFTVAIDDITRLIDQMAE